MNVVLWIILGALAGWIASRMTKPETQQGLWGNLLLGVLGAVAGGLVVSFFEQPGAVSPMIWQLNIYKMIVALVGAAILIWLGRLVYR